MSAAVLCYPVNHSCSKFSSFKNKKQFYLLAQTKTTTMNKNNYCIFFFPFSPSLNLIDTRKLDANGRFSNLMFTKPLPENTIITAYHLRSAHSNVPTRLRVVTYCLKNAAFFPPRIKNKTAKALLT